MKNILITGGAGFIGTNLSIQLLKDGNNVYILDDLSTGRQKNIEYLKNNFGDKVSFYRCDITRLEYLLAIKDGYLPMKIDEIYHLACPASPPKYWKDPIKTLDINYFGTKNVLELAKKYKARFLFTSTSEVYGDPLEHPQKETYNGNVNPVSPRSIYDEGKRVAETLVSEYHRQFGIHTKIARIFNTYGPFMDPDDGRVVTNFIKQFLEGKPFTIYGSGDQTRSLCYVDDMVNGLMTLMATDKFVNTPVNVGNPYEISMKGLAALISGRWYFEVERKPLPPSDPQIRNPDISRMRELGWSPPSDMQHLLEGLRKTTKYMEAELGERAK